MKRTTRARPYCISAFRSGKGTGEGTGDGRVRQIVDSSMCGALNSRTSYLCSCVCVCVCEGVAPYYRGRPVWVCRWVRKAGPCASENDTRGVCTGAFRVRHPHLGLEVLRVCVRGGSILSIVPLLPSFVSFSGQRCPALLLQGCPGPSAAVMRWGFGWGFGISVVGDPNASMPNVTLKSASSSLSIAVALWVPPPSAALRVADPTWWGQSAAQPMPTADHACPVGVRCDILRCPGVTAAPGVTPHSPSAGGGLSS